MYSDIDANMIPDEVSLLIHVQGRFHFMTMYYLGIVSISMEKFN